MVQILMILFANLLYSVQVHVVQEVESGTDSYDIVQLYRYRYTGGAGGRGTYRYTVQAVQDIVRNFSSTYRYIQVQVVQGVEGGTETD